jgi:hypothetical protein
MEIRYEKHYLPTRILSHPLLFISGFLLRPLTRQGMDNLVVSVIFKQILNPGPIMTIAIIGIILIIAVWVIYKRRLEDNLEAYLNIIGTVFIAAALKMQLALEYATKGIKPTFHFDVYELESFLFCVIAGIFLMFNIFYGAYGWDELEWERREKRREERHRHLWN